MHPVELFLSNLTEAFKMLGRDNIQINEILNELSTRIDAITASGDGGATKLESDILAAAEAAQFGHYYLNPNEQLPE